MNRARPQTRQIHEREHAQSRTRTQVVRVHEQSANGITPCPETSRQPVRIRDQAPANTGCNQASGAAMNSPETGKRLELSMSAISPLANVGRGPRRADNSPIRRLVVSIFSPTSFPVYIRNLPVYDLI